MIIPRTLVTSVLLFSSIACGDSRAAPGGAAAPDGIAAAALLEHVRVLSADSMEGRAIGTPGNRRARDYIVSIFENLDLEAFPGGYQRPFPQASLGEGVNVVGYVPGRIDPEAFILVTAHFDHLGVRGGQIFNGADDNGSGTAGLLALAAFFAEHPPAYSLIFAAVDGEEQGLLGARHLVTEPPVALERIALVVNLDMVSHSESELYAAGTFHYPFLTPHLEAVAQRANVELRLGHDSPDLGSNDWTSSSDHGPFHAAGVPFVYFGVEDHPDYHRPTDTFDTINESFFVAAIETVRLTIMRLDENLPELIAASGRERSLEGPR